MPGAQSLASAAVIGLTARIVKVEVDISPGLHSFTIVGLPDASVQEAKQRVSSAIRNSGLTPPRRSQNITINLAPASLLKQGPAYDLPIAMGFLLSSGQITGKLPKAIFVGELSLTGRLRPVDGILPISLLAKKQKKTLILPEKNAREASLVKGVKILPVTNIRQLVSYLRGETTIETKHETPPDNETFLPYDDLSYIRGQEQSKRALEIAVAGGHNILMAGPPGAGKTLLARSIPSILPKMSLKEALEVTKIYSIAGKLSRKNPLIKERPFRSPHHTASAVALIGGGNVPKPGEITLAHNGVLFLDEFPEFSRSVLESLRQPLQDKVVTISRASYNLDFPANFSLAAAMNLCPCGYLGDPNRDCSCLPYRIVQYKKRISGPIMDRIDIHINVPPVKYHDLASQEPFDGETSKEIRKRVENARKKQIRRFRCLNSQISFRDISRIARLTPTAQELLRQAARSLNLSARSYHSLLKVSRTIADLEKKEQINEEHLAEALQYRASEPAGS